MRATGIMQIFNYFSQLVGERGRLALLALWALCGLVAWLVVLLNFPTDAASVSGLALLAAIVAATSVALRLPLLRLGAAESPPSVQTQPTAQIPRTAAMPRSAERPPRATVHSTLDFAGQGTVEQGSVEQATAAQATPEPLALAVDHWSWWLSCLASVNWLGFFLLSSPRVWETLPALLLIVLPEVWWQRRMLRSGRLPWLSLGFRAVGGMVHWPRTGETGGVSWPYPAAGTATLSGTAGTGTAAGGLLSPADGECPPVVDEALTEELDEELEEALNRGLNGELNGAVENEAAEGLDEHLQRRTVEGIDEQGQRFLSGEVRVNLLGDQQVETVVIGFCPAFAGEPEVD
ncbi:MAG: hypothetical protein KDA45_05795, partial [Planctomycetales bacterium]|nr:hypothetical protein [Planctomycetales bacterium]